MSFGTELIIDILLNTTEITNAVDTFYSEPAIWFDTVCPENFKGTKSINFYLNTPVPGGLNYGDYTYTLNCRASSHYDADVLQQIVFTSFNRHNPLNESDRGLFICSALAIIPPANESDTYNAIVEVKVKTIN